MCNFASVNKNTKDKKKINCAMLYNYVQLSGYTSLTSYSPIRIFFYSVSHTLCYTVFKMYKIKETFQQNKF